MNKKSNKSNAYIAVLALGALAVDQVMNKRTRVDVDDLKKSAKEMHKDVHDTGKSLLAQQKVLKEMTKQLIDIGKRLDELEDILIVDKGNGKSEKIDISDILREYKDLSGHVKDLTETVSEIREGTKKVSPEQYKSILEKISKTNDHISEVQEHLIKNAELINLCVDALADNGFIEEVDEDESPVESQESEKEIQIPPVTSGLVVPEKKPEKKEREIKPLTQSLGEQIRKATSGVVAK